MRAHVRRTSRSLRLLTLTALVVAGCSAVSPTADDDASIRMDPNQPDEHRVQQLPLVEWAQDPELELSGLSWAGDDLILLPENLGLEMSLTGHPLEGDGFILALGRDQIEAAIDGDPAPLDPRKIPVTPSLSPAWPNFDGFEAIAIDGQDVWLSIETYPSETGEMAGLIVRGRFDDEFTLLTLTPEPIATIPSRNGRPNAAEEAIATVDGHILTVFELNGAGLDGSPTAHLVAPSGSVSRVAFPALEHRVTDATAVDDHGRFWVANYAWPGSDSSLSTVDDEPLRSRFGAGATHARYAQVERLVEVSYVSGIITLSDTPPLQIELDGDWEDGLSRNWEGLARLGDRGLLLVTDKFPTTQLAFVALPPR